MLNFNQLRAFYHAAKSQHFTKAAKELFITQPAITAQIKSLESACNLTLFRKKGRKLYLTNEGRILYEQVSKVFEYEKEIEKTISGLLNLSVGVLRVGTTKTYARYLMPSLVSRFLKIHPDIKIVVNEGTSKDMILDLLEFRNDVAIMSKVVARDEVSYTPFRREELVLILPPSHPLAGLETIAFKQIAKEPIIMKELGSGTRQEVNALFEVNECSPNILMESGNIELIKQLVMQGQGISFLVGAGVADEVAAGKLATVQLKGYQAALDVNIAYLRDQQLSLPARAFVSMLEELHTHDLPREDIGTLVGRILATTTVHRL
ncbi:MAG: LysR substrate-binding domain-containing protein [Deltaproteobacteria bacterium]|jgi:DNA-binding transcriptional LysR family regulator|nr:LysR substrate-binding domain-containing protein [Deltaproteobacteria bacterium]MDA8307777.1 LysR substrate-binding domain-containing protein [Deltaproteobacteria bacterium]